MSHEIPSSDRIRGEQNSDHRSGSERERVFNDETCRALRRGGRKAGRVAAVVGTFLIAEIAVIVLNAVSLPPLADITLTAAGLVGGSAATVGVMKRVNLISTRETLRETKRDLTREARAIAGDPQAIEARVEENSGPTARPELAVGLCPMGCFIAFGLPVMLLYVALGEVSGTTTILCVAGCIGLSGVLFAFAKREQPDTYPPEEPPTDRGAGGGGN